MHVTHNVHKFHVYNYVESPVYTGMLLYKLPSYPATNHWIVNFVAARNHQALSVVTAVAMFVCGNHYNEIVVT